VRAWRWVRFHIDLASAPSAPSDVRLTLIDDDVLAGLRAHSDAEDLACSSGLRFREFGMHDGFAWIDAGEPLCSMWLLTERDNAALAAMPEWADMYPPLAHGAGQVEKIWTYTTARHRGVATTFAYALFDEARRRGLRTLSVHIADFNQPALLWAMRSGWTVSGTITRYHIDVPGVRRLLPTVSFHGADQRGPAGVRRGV
jgi:L-amino acid N-acyltransferase YncA